MAKTKWAVSVGELKTLFSAIQSKWIQATLAGEPSTFTSDEGRMGYELAAALYRRDEWVDGMGVWLAYGCTPQASVACNRKDGFFPRHHVWTWYSSEGEHIGVRWDYLYSECEIEPHCPEAMVEKAEAHARRMLMRVHRHRPQIVNKMPQGLW